MVWTNTQHLLLVRTCAVGIRKKNLKCNLYVFWTKVKCFVSSTINIIWIEFDIWKIITITYLRYGRILEIVAAHNSGVATHSDKKKTTSFPLHCGSKYFQLASTQKILIVNLKHFLITLSYLRDILYYIYNNNNSSNHHVFVYIVSLVHFYTLCHRFLSDILHSSNLNIFT